SASRPAAGGRTLERGVVGLEQPEPPERPDESFDHPRLGQLPEFLAGPLADHCERSHAVELTCDEVFGFAETEEATCRRIFQAAAVALPADHEIVPELGRLLCHCSGNGFLKKATRRLAPRNRF